MSGMSANVFPQRFVFSHYPSPFSPGEDYAVEVLELSPTRLLVILDGTTPSAHRSIDPQDLPDLASRLWRKRLYQHDPEMIFWAIRLHGKDTAAEDIDEPRYQRLELSWDGERYSRAERRVTFNRAAFQAAFPAAADKRAAS